MKKPIINYDNIRNLNPYEDNFVRIFLFYIFFHIFLFYIKLQLKLYEIFY